MKSSNIKYPASEEKEIVFAENLSVGYDDKLVWREANFSINRGEFVAVIGPNGAGKTTLFRILLGLQLPMAGNILMFGERPRRGNPKIGYVPQRHLIDNDTNIEAVELVRLAYIGSRLGFNLYSKLGKDGADAALAAVGATDLGHTSLSSMSGGELQRIFLAEALVSNPEILLLDEPLSNLDVKRTKDLVYLMNTVVRSKNVTAFLVTHDINPMIQYLDKVIYMANGKVATGRPSEVLTSGRLSELYGTRVEVVKDSRGNIVVIGTEYGHEDEHNVI